MPYDYSVTQRETNMGFSEKPLQRVRYYFVRTPDGSYRGLFADGLELEGYRPLEELASVLGIRKEDLPSMWETKIVQGTNPPLRE
ncbi:MAG: hypothetical protein GW780_04710 [Candidatus Aenigmarchaeota archaeon]|nr:hypothetical protein [Candidatus Aenigmarchaeota archaeon]PIW41686.1 MAG: hypothetical protein COW21_00590 [Candidatus Aenigmarchaeota archaeon CG15_BIG_FIL_POST_REV_8_21_14_020_37_27]